MELKTIARIYNGFETKFGIPRQSGLVQGAESRIVFEKEYRAAEALRGIEDYSHLWIIWLFHEAKRDKWSPTVRPPRLGGNARMGVFATRSPFRPNPIGLSCVQLRRVEKTNEGLVLVVTGADLMNGTPILDIKPYLPYADSHPEALSGFAGQHMDEQLAVRWQGNTKSLVPPKSLPAVNDILSQDPRPHYQNDEKRIYGFRYDGVEIRFRVENSTAVVVEVMACE